MGLVTDILDVFAAFLLQLQGCTTLMPSRGVMPSSAGRETSSQLSSTTQTAVYGYPRADDGTLYICMSIDRSLVSENGGHDMLAVTS